MFLGLSGRLYRRRWWLSAGLMGVAVALGQSFGDWNPIVGVIYVLMVLLVWVPCAVRWSQAAHAARVAFREGLSDASRA
jgi:uncharacterized iron-regulated membrane protein